MLIEMLFVLIWYFLAYRAFGWIRRQKAIHRARFIEKLGMVENNPGRRLRGQHYGRVFFYLYAGLGMVLFFIIQSMLSRHVPPLASFLIAVWIPGVFTLLPAALPVGIYMSWREAVEPQGDLALQMFYKEFHKAGEPLQANNEFGSSKILNPFKAGLTNPYALITSVQPIVDPVVDEVAR